MSRSSHAPILTARATSSLSQWVHTYLLAQGGTRDDEKIFWAMANYLLDMEEGDARELVARRNWQALYDLSTQED